MSYPDHFALIDEIPSNTIAASTGGTLMQHTRAPSDYIFQSTLKLVSLQTVFGYYLEDKDSAEIGSGGFASSPQYYYNQVAFSDTDPVTVYFLKYGYQLKASGFVITPVETLLYMEHKVNTFVVADAATAEGYADTGVTDKIIVDKNLKTLTTNVSITDQQLYDYMQWYQSQPANASTLVDGNIFNTIDGDNFLLEGTWSRTYTGGPVYVAIDGDGVNHTGDFVKDVDGNDTLVKYAYTFTTIQAAWADPTYGNRDLITPNISQYYHVYRSTLPYEADEEYLYPVVGHTGINNRFVLTSAPEQQHKGVLLDAPKVIFRLAAYGPRSIIYAGEFVEVSHLYFYHGVASSGGGDADVLTGRENSYIHSNFVSGMNSQARNRIGIRADNNRFSGKESYIYNNVVFGVDIGIANVGYSRGNIINNLCINNAKYGIHMAHPCYYSVIANNVCLGNGISDFNNLNTIMSTLGVFVFNNASGDGSVSSSEAAYAPDYGMANDGTYLTDLVAANEFQDVASNDYHLTGSSRLRGVGYDTSAYGVTYDFEGEARVVPYSVGPDHPVTFNVNVKVIVKNSSDPTLPVIQGAKLYAKAKAGGILAEGTELFSGTTDVNGELTTPVLYQLTNQPFTVSARKGTSSPFFQEGTAEAILINQDIEVVLFQSSDEE